MKSKLKPIDFSEEHQRPVYRREDVLREVESLSADGSTDVITELLKKKRKDAETL